MEFDYLKPILAWLHLHPYWVGIATFLICFSESLAIIGLFLPGVILMTGIGTLVGSSVVPAWSTMAWAVAGAIVGDYLSFWFGHHYHQHIRDIWPFRKFPGLLEKGEAFFKHHGSKSVFLGRFAGPVRAITPVVAGMLNMPTPRFVFTSVCASILWAPSYMLPGIMLGAASQQLSPEAATRFLLAIILSVIVLWLLSWLVRRLFVWKMMYLNLALSRLWQIIEKCPSLNGVCRLLQDPENPHSHLPLAQAMALLFASTLLIVLAYGIIQQNIITSINLPFYYFFRSLRNHFLDHAMVAITFLGEFNVIVIFLIGVAVWLLWKRLWRAAIHWLGCGILAIVAGRILKILIHSPRPTGLVVTPAGWSFPSGHTTLAVTLFGFFAVLLSRSLPKRWCWLPYSVAGSLAVLVILSRLYLEAHWLTDVIGGALLGLCCVLLATLSYRHKISAAIPVKSLLLSALLTLASGWLWYSSQHYWQALYNHTPVNHPPIAVSMEEWWHEEGQQTPPYYRTDRFGKSVQTMNVQWAGSLKRIEQGLQKQGWQTVGQLNLLSAVSRLASEDPTQQLPLFNQLYLNRKPVLLMSKITQNSQRLVLLRLWDSNILLSNPPTKLWIGTIAYLRPWRPLNNKKKTLSAPPIPAIEVLISDLQNFRWKTIAHPNISRRPNRQDLDWNGFVLFIREGSS